MWTGWAGYIMGEYKYGQDEQTNFFLLILQIILNALDMIQVYMIQ